MEYMDIIKIADNATANLDLHATQLCNGNQEKNDPKHKPAPTQILLDMASARPNAFRDNYHNQRPTGWPTERAVSFSYCIDALRCANPSGNVGVFCVD